MSIFRILSLDGGGVRGAYTASALAALESKVGAPLVDHFDLIVGTSTGGIIAIGLGLGIAPARLAEFYKQRGADIFPRTGWLTSFVQTAKQLFVGTKHDQEQLLNALKSELSDEPFGHAKCPLVIVSYNASRDGPHLFKTTRPDHQRFKAYMVALATSAAPTYFSAVPLPLGKDGEEQVFVDGGIWANCPALVGVAEAVRSYGKRLEDLNLLSVGTTYKPFTIGQAQTQGSIVLDWNFGRDLAALVGSAQQAGTWGTTQFLLGEDHCIRVTSTTSDQIPLDDSSRIDDLIALGARDALERFDNVERMFFAPGRVRS